MNDPQATRPLLVLQHIDCEPPAAYEDELLDRGLTLDRICLHDQQPLPDWREYSAIIAMGGPMGVYDTDAYPWLAQEMRAIAQAVRSGMPFWGVCLGAQLLAASLGAPVAPGPQPEVGVMEVELTANAVHDRVFADAPTRFHTLQWHGDTFELPADAVHLARSQHYEQQAFVYRNAYALQFHLEVAPAMIREWGAVPAYAASLAQLPGNSSVETLAGQLGAVQDRTVALARELFARWLERVVGVPARVPR